MTRREDNLALKHVVFEDVIIPDETTHDFFGLVEDSNGDNPRERHATFPTLAEDLGNLLDVLAPGQRTDIFTNVAHDAPTILQLVQDVNGAFDFLQDVAKMEPLVPPPFYETDLIPLNDLLVDTAKRAANLQNQYDLIGAMTGPLGSIPAVALILGADDQTVHNIGQISTAIGDALPGSRARRRALPNQSRFIDPNKIGGQNGLNAFGFRKGDAVQGTFISPVRSTDALVGADAINLGKITGDSGVILQKFRQALNLNHPEALSAAAEIRVAKMFKQQGQSLRFLEAGHTPTADFIRTSGIKSGTKIDVKRFNGLSRSNIGNLAHGVSQVGDNGTVIVVRAQNSTHTLDQFKRSLEVNFVPNNPSVSIKVVDESSLPPLRRK